MTLTSTNYIPLLTPLVDCICISTFKSQAAIISKIFIIFAFYHVNAYVSKTDLILGSSFEHYKMGWSP